MSNSGFWQDKNNYSEKERFLFPRSSYWGEFTPEYLAFNANLQQFAHKVSLLSALETGGKLSPTETYQEIKALWKSLKRSKKNLLDQRLSERPQLPNDDEV
jgi:hypothetical protein